MSSGAPSSTTPDLKLRTARTLKWSSLDKIGSQVCYAVTGVVLANVLSVRDFGVVGAAGIFQGFTLLFADAGFGAALLQKKTVSATDYSTVFWLNLLLSTALFMAVFVCAPWLGTLFKSDELVPVVRVIMLAPVLTALGIVQTNKLTKEMNVRPVAVANLVSLSVGGAVGLVIAFAGGGAWALVWQTVVGAGVRTLWLWVAARWRPNWVFSRTSLRSLMGVGMGVLGSQLCNTVFQAAYPFIIGTVYSLTSLGYYNQASKWTKMGTASLSQIMTTAFVPLLAGVQDDVATCRRYIGRINRLAAFLLFPVMGGLIALAQPLFHVLFGVKWDAAVPMFQILAGQGIFVVLFSLYNNYLLALGHARLLVVAEVMKDVFLLGAIALTITSGRVVDIVWGQLGASVATYVVMLALTSRATHYSARRMLLDLMPYAALSVAAMGVAWMAGLVLPNAWLWLLAGAAVGGAVYWVVLRAAGSRILLEAESYALGRFRRRGAQAS